MSDKVKELLAGSGINYKETKRSYISDCLSPDCLAEGKMYTLIENGQTKCFKCNTTWNLIALTAAVKKISYKEAARLVDGVGHFDQSQKLHISMGEDLDQITDEDFFKPVKREIPVITLDPLFLPVEEAQAGIEYLLSRGVDNFEKYKEFDLRYSAVMNGIVFPVYMGGACVGWQCRFIKPFNPKMRMMTFPGMPKTEVLLNYDNAKNAENIILVEGPFDCIKASVSGYPAVASFGKIVSNAQIDLILNTSAQNVYIGLDRDAFEEVRHLFSKLSKYKNVYRLIPPQHRKDFGECSEDEIIQAIETAKKIEIDSVPFLEVYLKDS